VAIIGADHQILLTIHCQRNGRLHVSFDFEVRYGTENCFGQQNEKLNLVSHLEEARVSVYFGFSIFPSYDCDSWVAKYM
jgi:hypothetical protein